MVQLSSLLRIKGSNPSEKLVGWIACLPQAGFVGNLLAMMKRDFFSEEGGAHDSPLYLFTFP
ncbi:MAG TPA: hypothetical protein PKD96_04610, partial [Candidatus Absconditabacterales bacterium]|nr:hypothetical protein [Candidatus Absconditabacterales bacterium]